MLIKRKKIDLLLKSFRQFLDKVPGADAGIYLIGQGMEEEYLKKLSTELKLNERTVFWGFQANPFPFLINADIFALSSENEGISNSIMEYMAFSKPVVASEGGGTSELVINGETGVLIPPGSSDLLAQNIERLLNEPLLAQRMGRNGRARIENRFSIDMMVRETYQLYSEFKDED